MSVRPLLTTLLLLSALSGVAGPFTMVVEAAGLGSDVVSLHRVDDLWTLRSTPITRALLDATGHATLHGELSDGVTHRVQLRVGDAVGELFLRTGSTLRVRLLQPTGARSLSGTTRLGLEFIDLPPLDANALVTDLNERVDAFIAEDLATDRVAGMQAAAVTRLNGGRRDSTQRPPTLFVIPELSEQRLDTFEMKLRHFYREVNDPWFEAYLHFSMAGLREGPRANDRAIFERYLKNADLRYDNPEQVRFLRSFFADMLQGQVLRDQGDTLRQAVQRADLAELRRMAQRNDFLRGNERLSELVLLDQLHLLHPGKLLDRAAILRTLDSAALRSSFSEHRLLAANMRWDLSTMRAGEVLPALRVIDERDRPVSLDSLLQGPVCLAITATWCTYCSVEMAGLEQLKKDNGDAVRVIVIVLDSSATALRNYRKAHPGQDFIWLRALADQELREQLRLRSIPAFYVLNDTVLARSPAPLPSQGLGALFHRAGVEQERDGTIKVWEEPEGVRQRNTTAPTPR
jgi:thiol-disulfide isomerase/thioredoxin